MARKWRSAKVRSFKQDLNLDAALVRAAMDKNPGSLMNTARDLGYSQAELSKRFQWLKQRPRAYQQRVEAAAGLHEYVGDPYEASEQS